MSQYPKHPNRQQIEKIAQELVIEVRGNGALDPYEALKGTGYSGNILETLLKKFNIFNWLYDLENNDGDDRSEGQEPLSLSRLSDCGCGDNEGDGDDDEEEGEVDSPRPETGTSSGGEVIRIPTSQARDANKLESIDLSAKNKKEETGKQEKQEKKEEPEEKEASDNSDNAWDSVLKRFSAHSTEKLAACVRQIEDQLHEKAAEYAGMVNAIGPIVAVHQDMQEELVKIHPDSPVTDHLFKVAGVERSAPPPQKYKVASDTELGEKVAYLESLLKDIGNQQDIRDLLNNVISSRPK